ncbi:4Fe-4S dicluster domain-containing protein [Chloroflexota bacterium]
MAKVLLIDYEKCEGCLTCEMACSLKHESVINPIQSRIKVVKLELEVKATGIPIACAQCESAPCKMVCPVKAISRDELMGSVTIDYDKCIGCRMCVAICPFGAMNYDGVKKVIFKCDLCDGDPLCVKFCGYNALQYVEVNEQSTLKQRKAAEKIRAAEKLGIDVIERAV